LPDRFRPKPPGRPSYSHANPLAGHPSKVVLLPFSRHLAHAVTVPWKVMKILVENSLTGLGIEDFAINTKLNTFTVKQFISETQSSYW